VSLTRPHIRFDARERLTGDYDDITVQQAVEAYTQ
jgi:hypothetical protein